VVAILGQFGFEAVGQRGSHVKLRRMSDSGERQTLTVPRHRELDAGTLLAIFRQATRFISAAELRPHFYAD
jgi:predicted RNA binding protein YcfA (HicA-like mRNA interferase family)